IRIVGRHSQRNNVGGEKVVPTEVENVLLQAYDVRDVVVQGSPNPVTGQFVVAYVELRVPESRQQLTRRLREFCLRHLAPYKVPAAFAASNGPLHGNRFKRRGDSA